MGDSRKHKRVKHLTNETHPAKKIKNEKAKTRTWSINLSTGHDYTLTHEHSMHICTHTHTRMVGRTPKGGQMQMSALFGIFVANLSLGKSEGLAGV